MTNFGADVAPSGTTAPKFGFSAMGGGPAPSPGSGAGARYAPRRLPGGTVTNPSSSDSSGLPADLRTTARRAGAHAWLSARLFEVVGGWAASTPGSAGMALLLGEHTYHYAWHAELFRERLPELREWPRDEFVVPSPAGEAAIDALRSLGSSPVERAAGLYRGLSPRLLTAYDVLLGQAVPVTDAPLIRTLQLVARDARDDGTAGETALQRLLVGPEELDEAMTAAGSVERAIVVAGGL